MLEMGEGSSQTKLCPKCLNGCTVEPTRDQAFLKCGSDSKNYKR